MWSCKVLSLNPFNCFKNFLFLCKIRNDIFPKLMKQMPVYALFSGATGFVEKKPVLLRCALWSAQCTSFALCDCICRLVALSLLICPSVCLCFVFVARLVSCVVCSWVGWLVVYLFNVVSWLICCLVCSWVDWLCSVFMGWPVSCVFV